MAWNHTLGGVAIAFVAAALIAAVIVGVYHAEIIAHRVGEPFGTLILALAVTVIEASLIVSMMLAGNAEAATLGRDTVFAAVMIVCNGIVGICLLLGSLRHHVMVFRVEGTSPMLSLIAALATLTLVLPAYTITTSGPTYAESQLVFAGVMSLVLYGVFVFVQTVRHRDYFLPVSIDDDSELEQHAPPPLSASLASGALLLVCLVSVVGLAKTLSPQIRQAVSDASAPPAVVGVVVALLVLLPESVAAIRAALQNRMQTSLNLALGSVVATIGLTIPAIAGIALLLDLPLVLGITPKDTVLLVLTLLVGATTLTGGSATLLQGTVHLVLFAAFLFLSVVP